MKYKSLLVFGLFSSFFLSYGNEFSSVLREKGGLVLVKDGESYAEIIIPKHAPATILDSANTLSEYIFKSSGVKVNVSMEGSSIDPDKTYISLGKTMFCRDQGIIPSDLGDQGFVIAFPDEKLVVIDGQSDIAVEFGVYEFLERYLGVRWLFPGELGEYVPAKKELILERNKVEQNPALHSRVLSGVAKLSTESAVWGKRNRMFGDFAFHHNVGNIFPPAKYTKTHPEFYPIIYGRRQLPTTLVGWQPCFTAKGSVDEAVKNILDVFERFPEKTSFSLGVNDNSGFCECAGCSELDGNKTNTVGCLSRSESYYSWCNAVVEKVLNVYPDKQFGLLAYSDIIDPPETLNSHIIPYLCYDRMIWLHPENEEIGKKLLVVACWRAASTSRILPSRIKPFCIPVATCPTKHWRNAVISTARFTSAKTTKPSSTIPGSRPSALPPLKK